jgi:hypothetical protein
MKARTIVTGASQGIGTDPTNVPGTRLQYRCELALDGGVAISTGLHHGKLPEGRRQSVVYLTGKRHLTGELLRDDGRAQSQTVGPTKGSI